MFIVKSKAIRDTESKYGFVDTFTAKTRVEAESIAVLKYLENFADTGEFGQRFLQILKYHKHDRASMVNELFNFFQANESEVFAGENVDKTFSIVLESEESNESRSDKTK